MEDNTSEDITIDEKLSAHGFYEVDSIDEDGVYTLKDYDKTASSIDEDSDGIVVEDLALDNTDQIYRNALSGSIDNVKFDDVSIANATIIDGRSNPTGTTPCMTARSTASPVWRPLWMP